MGRTDKAAKLFYSKPLNFISVVKLVYGENVVAQEAEDMREGLFSYVEKMLGYEEKGSNFKGVLERNRDVVKKIRIDNQSVILGIENQQKTDYSEPIRVMLYDAMSYEEQCRIIRWMHQNEKDLKSDEYVAGFSHEDRVMPVETIVIYYGEDEWIFPKKLSDICPIKEKSVLKSDVQDYKIKVIDVRRLSDEQINSLSSEVKLLFGCVKYSKDIKKLREFIEKDKLRFESLPQETYEIIALMTKTDRLLKEMKKVEEGGKYNMCKAIDDMIEEGRQAGRTEGIKAGMEAGRQENMLQNIKKIMKNLNMAAREAMNVLDISQSEQELYIKLLKE